VLLVLQESMLMLFLLLTALVIIVMQLAQPALEGLTLNAWFVMAQLLLWLMEMNAEECALELTTGGHQIIHASPVWLPVLTALGLELMTVTAVLVGFIYQEQHQIVAWFAT
jgi:hypothetical protein